MNRYRNVVLAACLIFVMLLANIRCNNKTVFMAQIDPDRFEAMVDGKAVKLFQLVNKNGLEMTVTNFGAKVVSLMVPDKNGDFDDVVLGFDNIDSYLNANKVYLGAVIGRYGNRIANGEFSLDGVTYKLPQNDGKNHLHGGEKGYNAVVWDVLEADDQSIVFEYLSPDMDAGYPGDLMIKMTYTLNDDNEFRIDYEATTNKRTPVNLTHHTYFNLLGAGSGSVNNHKLMINADRYTPVDSTLIPDGTLASVSGTPLDFRKPFRIGERIEDDFEQLKFGKGYDHNWVLNDSEDYRINCAASVYEPVSGRLMEVFTDEPGIQFYGGNFLDGKCVGKKNKAYEFRSAFCLETQHFPNSPNEPTFPSTILNPGETYSHACVYRFSVH